MSLPGAMTSISGSILADPHKLSWLMLMAFAIAGVAIPLVAKVIRQLRRPRIDSYKQIDILSNSQRMPVDPD